MTTTEEVERVTHLAMEQAGGKSSVAAKLLGLTSNQITDRIRGNKNLNSRWGKTKKDPQAPGEAVTIHRTPPADDGDIVLQTEQEIAEALKKEDAAVKRGLDNMGLPEKVQKLGLALRAFQGQHFKSSLQMVGGGITMQFLSVMAEIQAIDERLAVRFGGDFPLTYQEEIMLREDRSRLLIVMSQFSDRVNKAALTQAKIYQMMKKEDNKPGQNGKPKGYLNLESANP